MGLAGWLCFFDALVGLAIGRTILTGKEVAVNFFGSFL